MSFNLRNEILREHSKTQCLRIVKWIGNDQLRFDRLFTLFLQEDYRIIQRSAWPISIAVGKHPHFISKHWKKFLLNLHKDNLYNAVKRNSIRLLQDINIPEKYHGEIMTLCFNYLESPSEAIAVKVFSLTVLGNLAIIYPEIKPELKLVIENLLPGQGAGFKSRAKKILKQIAV